MGNRILIIDDDPDIANVLNMVLSVEGFEVDCAMTGMEGLEKSQNSDPDLIIMDLGLPDIEGQQLCKAIRKGKDIPLIVLSARDNVADKVLCLEYGADDYMTKPFESIELVARIQSVLRRSQMRRKRNDSNEFVRFGLTFDLDNQLVFRDREKISLTPKEYELLLYFANHTGRVIERDKIIEDLWGKNNLYRWSRSLDVHVQHLRKKIETNPKAPFYIQTISGVGYKINP